MNTTATKRPPCWNCATRHPQHPRIGSRYGLDRKDKIMSQKRLGRILGPLAVAAVAVFGLSGCLEAHPDRSIYHVGDSITMSAAWYNDDAWEAKVPEGYAYKQESFMGDKVPDHLDKVAEYGAKNIPERLVVELGSNDARGGWGDQDRANYQRLVDSAPERTCVVGILPYIEPEAVRTPTKAHLENFGAARADIEKIVSARPMHQVADMAEFATAHPEMMGDDGLHLRTNTDDQVFNQKVKDTYRDWVFGYVNACEGKRIR